MTNQLRLPRIAELQRLKPAWSHKKFSVPRNVNLLPSVLTLSVSMPLGIGVARLARLVSEKSTFSVVIPFFLRIFLNGRAYDLAKA